MSEDETKQEGTEEVTENLKVLENIDVVLTVEVGRTEITIRDLLRLNEGSVINNLDVYPNPTRDIFNVSFVSDEIQTLSIRVLNIVGEIIYEESLEEFVGEYTKQINLGD